MQQLGALSGLRVIDLSRMLPGPYCSMILADHGAEVIAIEDRRFQKDGLFFSDLNRNKRHMSLNLKSREGQEIFTKLVEKADVLLEGFRPGVVQRLGIDYDTLHRKNPRLIYCSISGYGQTGPMVEKAGHDVNYLSMAGILALVGERDHPPAIPGVQIADVAGGSMNAAIGILLALFARERTGEGQYIDISMTDGVLGLLSLPYFFARQSGMQPERANMLLAHRYGCYNTYETSDGRFLALGAVENRFWRGLCEYLLRPDFIPLQYDERHREEIIAFLRRTFREKTLAEWLAAFAGIDICCTPVNSLQDVFQDPLFAARKMIHRYQDSTGRECFGFGIPVKLSKTPGTIRTPPGQFAADTKAILAELGYSPADIEFLISSQAV